MSARDAILSAVRMSRPAEVPLPDLRAARNSFPSTEEDVAVRFIAAARASGADVIEGPWAALAQLLTVSAPGVTRVVSQIAEVTSGLASDADVRTLASAELFVCEAQLGVAENGAVWLPASRLGNRAALFLAEHVVVALNRADIVSDLHAAYDRIDVAAEGFGTFVAGPSKTADIEQSLVIGAHGPKRLSVLLLEAS